jgi:hypothetical protein
MGLPIFEIEVGFEARIAGFLNGHGYEFLLKRKRIQLDGPHPGIEQYWSINSAGKEVAVVDIVDTNKGKKILIWGPLRDRRHKTIYRLLKDEVLKLGAKPLDDLNSAFEPSERTKN